MLGSKGAEQEFSHVRLIDAEEENGDEGKNNNGEEGEKDIDNGPPVGMPILVHKIESYEDGPQPMHSNVDIEVGRRRPSCRNPYTPFLDMDEFEFAFRLIKQGISNISKKKFRRDALHLQVRPIPAPHFIVRQQAPCIYLSALSALKFHLSPYPQPHLPARPILTRTSTFPSLLLGQLALVTRLGTYTRHAPQS